MVVPLRLASSIYISIYHFNSRSIKLKFTLSFALTVIWLITLGQRSGIELTFTAVNNTTYVQLDSIRFMNRTQGGETMLFWPDTVLTVLWVGIPESSSVSDGFNQYQNYPNPVGDQTEALYFLSATWKGFRRSIKLLNYGPGDNQRCSFSCLDSSSLEPEWKSQTSTRDFIINPGDELLYAGYSTGKEYYCNLHGNFLSSVLTAAS